MTPSDAKPRWIARNKREHDEMVSWVNARLDEGRGGGFLSPEEADFIKERMRTAPERYQKWLREGGPEQEMARQGDIGPLREFVRKALGADIAEYVQLLTPKRGKKYLPYPDERKQRIANAVADARRIKRIWAAGYGQKERSADDGPSAIGIAATRHGVGENEVAEGLKRAPRVGSWRASFPEIKSPAQRPRAK
jgi:hypothetical protein